MAKLMRTTQFDGCILLWLLVALALIYFTSVSSETGKTGEVEPVIKMEEATPATAEEYRFAIAEVLKEDNFGKIVGESYYKGFTIFTFVKKDGKFYVAVFKGKERVQ